VATPSGEASASLLGEQLQADQFAQQVGESLVASHQDSNGGWRFPSEIQSPHFQTDRDVGAASVLMGFLALDSQYSKDSRWLNAAKQTATWLEAVSKQDAAGGRYWPDYADKGKVSESYYTSFDDGTIGVADAFWRLYERTGDAHYKTIAQQGVEWTMAHAENVGLSGGDAVYRWKYDVGPAGDAQDYEMGMGEGQVGIVDALTTFYTRTKDTDPAFAAKCKNYIAGGLRYINAVQAALGGNDGDSRALPEVGVIGQDGDTLMNTGYLSGAAGLNYMYLHLYQALGGAQYLQQAEKTLSWLNATKTDFGHGTAAWKIATDPQDDNTEDTVTYNHYATGVEEGNAGIGWSMLQGYNLLRQKNDPNAGGYLTAAKQAADWLLKTATNDKNGGLSWPEYQNPASPLTHANLDNGAAGISVFLMDVYRSTGDKRYLEGAQAGQEWLVATATNKDGKVYWKDSDEGSSYANDPSWHWGESGAAASFIRLAGGELDMPGEQPGLVGTN